MNLKKNKNLTDEEKAEEFKKRLKYILEVKNLSQADLARLLNISRAGVNKYLRLNKMPTYEVIKNISDVLDIPFEWINLEIDDINKVIELEFKEKKEKIKSDIIKIPYYILDLGDEPVFYSVIFKEYIYINLPFLNIILGNNKNIKNYNNLAFISFDYKNLNANIKPDDIILINSDISIVQNNIIQNLIFTSTESDYINGYNTDAILVIEQ